MQNFKNSFWLFAILPFLLILNACNKTPSAKIDFATLSELEKRKPENALASMQVADSLSLELFASEPMVRNPTNMAIDAKGRIWVCEGTNYRLFANPKNAYEKKGDRILILEDTDGDGQADVSKVFYQGEDINAALGIVVLGDKIIVSVSPNVFVFTDTNGDDIPDSKEILFSGIDGKDHDHGVHAFTFGADGRLYFNFGNEGGQLLDKAGDPIKDIYGRLVNNSGHPFRQGMAFRSDLNGANIEVLGFNFRNPYELTVDSYGGLWQSDNDDDGNRGTRINFVMEYGNFGFKDLLTGQSWQERRTGWDPEIPKRHWHLNDPGTVPNLLQTGSGSPCGILVYEDTLLPKKYRNQLIHAEPGHNVVRSYLIQEEGAGYTAKIENLVKSEDDWFRPDDVTVAPDGSLFIADWYDGGVGGHKAEDIARGRIYHLSTSNGYHPRKFDLSTGEGALEGVLSDNMDVFYQSWQRLHSMGESAEPLLEHLIAKGGTAKARALWLAAQIPTKAREYIDLALADSDTKFRIQGIRMARFLEKDHLEDFLERIIQDPSPQVRREAAIALAFLGTPRAAELWASLASQHQAGDRWSLEALGIGSDQHADGYFSVWKSKNDIDLTNAATREIIWRMRAQETVPLLAEMIRDPKLSKEKLPSYFRAFSFKDHPRKNEIIMGLLKIEGPNQKAIQALAIGQLDERFVNGSSSRIQMVSDLLPQIEGTPEWLMALKNLRLPNQNKALFRVISNSTMDEDIRRESLELLLKSGGLQLLAEQLQATIPASDKMELIGLIGNSNDSSAVELLIQNLNQEGFSAPLKRRMVEGLGNTWDGQHALYTMLKENKLASEFKKTAVLRLMNSWDVELRENAPKYLDEESNAPIDVAALIERKGDSAHGKEIYGMYCSACHIAGNEGIDFGPSLSDIGNKLSKDFLYSNIIDPSAGISFGYEGYSLTMKDGATYSGYILSKSEDKLTLKMMGGVQKEIERANIDKLEAMEKSLMTEGLDKVMNEDEMVDLVAYLSTLKVAEEGE
ncbi:MAG: c-type cytochrome [Maribacter sp.]|nr:c-type cytochrome [Maribacter sp.]